MNVSIEDLNERTVERAKKVFAVLSLSLGIDKKRLLGWNTPTYFKDVNKPDGLLPALMRHSDLLALQVLGARIWSVDYVESEAYEYGLSVTDSDLVAVADNDSGFMMVMLCQLALHHMVIELEEHIDVETDFAIYKREMSVDGEVWQFPSKVELLETFSSYYFGGILSDNQPELVSGLEMELGS